MEFATPASGGSGKGRPGGSMGVNMKEVHWEAIAADRLLPRCISSGYLPMETVRPLAQASLPKLGWDSAATMDWAGLHQSAAGGSSIGVLLTSLATEAEIQMRRG
uniref:Uncharacterized protein n=1 Tax=Arundo donax TaxID=35708 RepID=A0A0A9A437_ARUDO